jgi:type VII secretion integral membrane protein EccD
MPVMSFSRVTLVGERQRVDAVLPSDEPVGRLLPDVLRLVGDSVESPPHLRQLVTADGGVLSWDGTLAGAGIPDGAVLTVVHADNAPPAPVVHDVTEEAADDVDLRSWRWGPRALRWTATALTAVALFVAGALTVGPLGAESAAVVMGVAAAALVLGGGLLGRLVQEPAGTAVTVGGGTLGVLAVWTAANAHQWDTWARWGGIFLVAAAVLAFLGVTSPLGRGGVLGAGSAVVLTTAWMVLGATDLPLGRLAAVLSVGSVVLLGLLPRLALSISGLAGLDDRRSAGAPVSRHDVETALAATHRGLIVATLAAALSGAVAGYLLAGRPDRWTVPLALLLTVVLASRSRTFPLIAQVVALQVAAVVVLFGLVTTWADRAYDSLLPALVVAAAAAGPLAVLATRPPEHVRVRLRRIADRLEAVAVIGMIPVAIGVFGTYGRLLHVIS